MRCPKPQSGAVRNSLGPACPERLRRQPVAHVVDQDVGEQIRRLVAQRRDPRNYRS